jgi:peptidoglycan/LPS O-acetylase OafA/YrhL
LAGIPGPAGASPSATGQGRLEYVDGLRACAALWVAVHHALETAIPKATLSMPVVGPIVSSLRFGQSPVMVFLMLSGFCLYYPCVRMNASHPAMTSTYAVFLARRAKRILPPYLWAMVFCLCLAAVPALQVGKWQAVGPVRPAIVLTHLLLIHNLIPSHAIKIDYPMWSIGLEWQLYLLFPLLVWSFRKRGTWTVASSSSLWPSACP